MAWESLNSCRWEPGPGVHDRCRERHTHTEKRPCIVWNIRTNAYRQGEGEGVAPMASEVQYEHCGGVPGKPGSFN